MRWMVPRRDNELASDLSEEDFERSEEDGCASTGMSYAEHLNEALTAELGERFSIAGALPRSDAARLRHTGILGRGYQAGFPVRQNFPVLARS